MIIELHRGMCPVTGKLSFGLYESEMPVIPATVYLRHLGENVKLDSNTILAYARALKIFFTFLQRNDLSFWHLTPADIKRYKRFHLSRVNETEEKTKGEIHGNPGPTVHQRGGFILRRRTVQQYLNAVKGLVRYWRGLQDNDPFFEDVEAEMKDSRTQRRRPGHLLHAEWYTRVPHSLWRVRIPLEEKHDKIRYKGLTSEQCRMIMQVLNQAKYHTDLETMLYYRNRAIWTFLLMSCLRKGELVCIRLEDVNPNTGIITLKDRPMDRWLGELKTGPGEIYVTPENLYWQFLDSWLMHGRWIAVERLESKGEKDHGLLFCNRNGGPLTQAAIDNLFGRLNKTCNFDDSISVHPHITRHTTASLMLEADMPLTEVQKYLRHRSIKSTEAYANVSAKTHRQAMDRYWKHYGLLL